MKCKTFSKNKTKESTRDDFIFHVSPPVMGQRTLELNATILYKYYDYVTEMRSRKHPRGLQQKIRLRGRYFLLYHGA